MATGVEAFLDALPPETRPLVLALRDVVRPTAPHTDESLLWAACPTTAPRSVAGSKGALPDRG